MKKSILNVSVAGILAISFMAQKAKAQPDLYSFPEIEGTKPTAATPAPKALDPFMLAVSKKLALPQELLSDAVDKGLGRLEVLRLALISKKSNKPLKELLEQREKLVRFAKISKDAGVDNAAIKKEAKVMYQEILREMESTTVTSSTATKTAGIEPPPEQIKK